MTAEAGTRQPTRTHRPGRIIERPRLIKQLDAAEAPVILIVAPAGYGKTTLARQWARTLSGVIWVSCTPSHRDVVTFAEDVAAGIDALGGDVSRFVGEYVRARSNPQRAAREIAQMLARKINEAPVQWLVIDDYQELAAGPEIEAVLQVLRERTPVRLLVASRFRPAWATPRTAIYGDVSELTQAELALTAAEATAIVGKRPDLEPLIHHAKGWPAVVALLARLHRGSSRAHAPSTIHGYVANELFRYADATLRQQLLQLALLPNLEASTLARAPDELSRTVLDAAADLGFVTDGEPPEIHPLARDFLLSKLADDPDSRWLVEQAVELALVLGAWDFSLDLVLRFNLRHLVDPVLQRVFQPLVRSGKLGTLTGLRDRIRDASSFAPPAVDLIDAEVAMRDGQFVLASDLARRAASRLTPGHTLRSRAFQIIGRAGFFSATFAESATAYRQARQSAVEPSDEAESVFGLASVEIFGEAGDARSTLAELERHRYRSPTELLRYTTTLMNIRRFSNLADPLPIDEGLHALRDATDPQARTAFTYTAAYVYAQRANYERASELLGLLLTDVHNFDLDFIQPFADWLAAAVDIGMRRFGSADRHLQRVEDTGASAPMSHHAVNATMLRARLLLQMGRAAEAVDLLEEEPNAAIFPSWRGEFRATRALALACDGHPDEANAYADLAESTSRFVEITVFAEAARAVAAASANDARAAEPLFERAKRLGIWDPVLCAVRSSQALLVTAADNRSTRTPLTALLTRTADSPTSRRAGLRSRATRAASDLLTPRELEVLGLVAQGMRNREIAAALFVEESTVKVHVRHVLEKLGVRSRAAAVARYERSSLR